MSTSTHPNTSLRSLIDTSRVLRGRAVLQADAKARDESGNDQAGNMMSGVEERMKELQIKHAKSAERAEKLKNALKRLQDASQGRKGGVDLLSESSIGRITAEALDAVGDFLVI